MFDEWENELIEKIIFWKKKFVGREKNIVYVRYYCSEFNCAPMSAILSGENILKKPWKRNFIL